MYMSIFDHHNKTLISTNNSLRQQKTRQVGIQVRKVYHDYCQANTLKKQVKELWKLIKFSHINPVAQQNLAQVLQLPYIPGPFSLNSLPGPLLRHNQKLRNEKQETTQLQFLFDYLRNTREVYICWIIYYSEDLKVLTVKLLKEDELQDYQDLFNPNINMIGMFIRHQPENLTKNLSPSELLQYYSSQKEICKKHVKSTPNNSTQSSWKMKVMRSQSKVGVLKVKSSKFKFRSLSPMINMSRWLFKKDKYTSQKLKDERSISMMRRQTKSKSNINLLSTVPQNLRLESAMFSKKFNKGQQVKKGLRKENKFNRIQRVYQKDY